MALPKGIWLVRWDEKDNCVDIYRNGEAVDALNEIGWSPENLRVGDELYIPEKVRKYAAAMWRTRGKDEVSV